MKSEFKHLYREHDRFFTINDGDGTEPDPDLTPIVILLSSPPKDITKIKNYGLHPDEQVYVRDEIPLKLDLLAKRAVDELQAVKKSNVAKAITGHKIICRYWDIIERERDEYEKEIAFIKNVIWKCVYGEWVYIDGKPTYISPWHYEYLNFWYMPDVIGFYPELRDRDKKTYHYNWYLFNATETFANIDDDGNALRNERGIYEMRDTGGRVFYGSIQPKNRRSGNSNMGLEIVWAIIRKSIGKHGTIVSKSYKDVKDHFQERFIPAWQKYPLFIKPTWDGDNSPATRINLKPPSNDYSYKGLLGSMSYPDSTSEISLDSGKIGAALFDEQGKATGGGKVDVFERWETNKQTMAQGDGAIIEGFCLNPSTCEEMEDGAVNYKAMCDLSDFYVRMESGQTKSGLSLIYFPAQVALEGFIGPFGESIVEKPTERQIRLASGIRDVYKKRGIGAKEHLLSERNILLKSGREEDLKKYRSLRRKHPMKYAESWIGSSGDMGWDIEKVTKRLLELNTQKILKKEQIKRGNFRRVNSLDKNSRVEWVTDLDHGRFEMGMDLRLEQTNQKVSIPWFDVDKGYTVQAWAPQYKSVFTCGGDPFEWGGRASKLRETSSRQSDGGIGILWEHDSTLDSSEDMEEWDSYSFVLVYRARPSADQYNEDVLLACIYFGAMFYPENNIPDTWRHFIESGYAGYLKYDINPLTGKRAEKPGFRATEASKTTMFGLWGNYIDKRIHKERFASVCEEILKMNGPEDMTKQDEFAACGAALMGSKSSYGKRLDRERERVMDVSKISMFRKTRL